MSKLSGILCSLVITGLVSFVLASGPAGGKNMLLKSTSTKELVETARNHQWSINFSKQSKDTLLIIALRVQFASDTSLLTTGNGLFGIRDDAREQKFYNQDTIYKFDATPHDSLYFARQLEGVRNYFQKVSRGNLTLDYEVYPSGPDEIGFKVTNTMTHYSPGWKKKKESTDEYWNRKTNGLMQFVRDAVDAANGDNSPFRKLYRDSSGVLRDKEKNRKAVILIFHAGASYLTDGGENGAAGADSPSDMIDAFINKEFFKFYKDSLGLKDAGVSVVGDNGQSILIDELMMCAETSNQDGLNWGIQGVLVNQVARQLGIPDLFSTSNQYTAVGAFCIMDFAGYSAGRGFIPPYPSAWVRAFMGWDKVYPASISGSSTHSVKALSLALDHPLESQNDTTILLVPINSHEYYLIENRQRNLSGKKSHFNYDKDAAEIASAPDSSIIASYPFNVNLDSNVQELASEYNVILKAENNDVSLPASGVLVWHIDERVIRDRLSYNFVNADSTYRGVRLVEADGINDLGIVSPFYQAAYDYGGAEDIFPYRTTKKEKVTKDVKGFGPYSRPSTRSNDGGHTYLHLQITPSTPESQLRKELSMRFDTTTVINFSDSVFRINLSYDYQVPGWPKKVAPEKFHDPLSADISESSAGKELVLLSESGRLYVYATDTSKASSFGSLKAPIQFVDYKGDTLSDSLLYAPFLDSIEGAFTFPSYVGNSIYIPSKKKSLHIYNSVTEINANHVILSLHGTPTSYVCGTGNDSWVLGLEKGKLLVGEGTDSTGLIKLASDSSVCAIAVMRETAGAFAAIQTNGLLSLCNSGSSTPLKSVAVPNGIGPFTLVSGDINRDGKSELVVADSRHGIWVYDNQLSLMEGWKEKPNDWANAYYVDPEEKKDVRSRYPRNFSAPALADLNRDGYLDIIVSGTNGVYALNYKGALLSRWPAYLDNRYWYQRGSITTSPVVVSGSGKKPLVLFSSPTGEKATFMITKIETADRDKGTITFRREDGTLDSLWDLSAATIDTVLELGDSLIYPYVIPGGFIDALTADANRPLSNASALGSNWPVPQSTWPISAGGPVTGSPLVTRSDNTTPDLFAASSDGLVYRWRLPADILPDSLYWPQNGYDAARSFAYGSALPQIEYVEKEPLTFWNYPNPTAGASETTFKYKFSGQAKNVRLDIYTITGHKMDSFTGLSGSFPDWNEIVVKLGKYGPGIYRCRMEAHIGGTKHTRFWKMAVVK